MERLTQWVDDGEKRYAIPRVDIRNMGHEKCCTQLAKYEDTGMTPEQVKELQMDWVAMKVVSETYKKEKAEKPEVYGDGYDNSGNLIYDEWKCPRCGKSYEMDYDDYDYCPNCGQKIDWSDDDE